MALVPLPGADESLCTSTLRLLRSPMVGCPLEELCAAASCGPLAQKISAAAKPPRRSGLIAAAPALALMAAAAMAMCPRQATHSTPRWVPRWSPPPPHRAHLPLSAPAPAAFCDSHRH